MKSISSLLLAKPEELVDYGFSEVPPFGLGDATTVESNMLKRPTNRLPCFNTPKSPTFISSSPSKNNSRNIQPVGSNTEESNDTSTTGAASPDAHSTVSDPSHDNVLSPTTTRKKQNDADPADTINHGTGLRSAGDSFIQDEFYFGSCDDIDVERSQSGGSTAVSLSRLLGDPPSYVVMHPEPEPYAQLLFEKKHGILTSFVMQNHGLVAPFAMTEKTEEDLTSDGLMSLDENRGDALQPELDPSPLNSMVLSSSASDGSGWSTGNDEDSWTLADSVSIGEYVQVEGDFYTDETFPQVVSSPSTARFKEPDNRVNSPTNDVSDENIEKKSLLGPLSDGETGSESDLSYSSHGFQTGCSAWLCSCLCGGGSDTNKTTTTTRNPASPKQPTAVGSSKLFCYIILKD